MRLQIILISALLAVLFTDAIAAEKFQIDHGHSVIRFSVPFAALTEVEGRFTDFSGTILYDDQNLSKSMVAIAIKPASLNTANEMRDQHLKGSDFLDIEKFPLIQFESKSVSKGASGYTLTGKLSMHGIIREVSFPFEITRIIDAWENTRVGARAQLKLNRNDFGIGTAADGWWNKLVNARQNLVGNEIQIELKLQGVVWNIKRINTGENSPSTVLFKTIMESGMEEGLKQYERMKKENQEQFTENEFGVLGLKLAAEKGQEDAIRIYQIALEAFPRSAYLFNKLGGAYEKSGNLSKAIEFYRKALVIEPHNTNAIVMLKSLEQ